jgi:hypothetical protein
MRSGWGQRCRRIAHHDDPVHLPQEAAVLLVRELVVLQQLLLALAVDDHLVLHRVHLDVARVLLLAHGGDVESGVEWGRHLGSAYV